MSFRETQDPRHLGWASGFLGLAALARNDGLILFPIFLFLAVLFAWKQPRWWAALLGALAPFAVLVGGYILLQGAVTGDFSLGTLERTYLNFEAGQEAIYAGTGALNPVTEARLEARRVFGTPEENNYSVFQAIRRNPSVYLERVRAVTLGLPRRLLQAYGIRFAALLALLVGRGVLALIRQRDFALLAALLLWPVHLVTGFVITIFRHGHLQFPYYIIFALAAIGLTALLANLTARRERLVWTAALLALAAYGVLGDKLAIYYGAALFLAALWVAYAVKTRWAPGPTGAPLAALILLAAGLIIRGNFPSPYFPALGEGAKEQAAVYMSANLPPAAKVAAGSPGVVWMARMTYANLTSPDVPRDKDSAEFLAWMIQQDIQAVYVDHSLYNSNPFIWDLLKPEIGEGLERVFVGDEGDIQVLVVKPVEP